MTVQIEVDDSWWLYPGALVIFHLLQDFNYYASPVHCLSSSTHCPLGFLESGYYFIIIYIYSRFQQGRFWGFRIGAVEDHKFKWGSGHRTRLAPILDIPEVELHVKHGLFCVICNIIIVMHKAAYQCSITVMITRNSRTVPTTRVHTTIYAAFRGHGEPPPQHRPRLSRLYHT